MVGIFVVQVLNAERLLKSLKKDDSVWLTIEGGKDLIRDK